MQRRDLLTGSAVSVAALSAPALAQGARRLSLVTDWSDGPGILPSARRFAKTVLLATEGRLQIDVSAVGEVVRPMETFDAVAAGAADMFHSHIGYFEAHSPAFHFYSGVPFGLTASELYAWARFGGGQELFDELGENHGIKPLLCASTGAQMGGWFRAPLVSVDDLKGLRYRMAGLGAEVYRRLGATVILVPAADIITALRSGAIDACEWIGPWLDMEMGLHKLMPHYYVPGWQEPGTGIALGINLAVWHSLTVADQQVIEIAASSEFLHSLCEFDSRNAAAIHEIRHAGTVQIGIFPADMLRAMAEISSAVVAETGSADQLSQRVLKSYQTFLQGIAGWTDTATRSYLSNRVTNWD